MKALSMRLMFVTTTLLTIFGLSRSESSSPVMGFSTWNQFACEINETLVIEQANAIVKLKLNELGYEFVNVDDCWQAETRDETGRLRPDPVRFPRGIKWLASRVHDLGLKFGIYTCIGTHTCEGLPGSYDHYEIDAKTFAEWDVDFVKVDTCSLTMEQNWDPEPFYEEFARAMKKESGKILYSVCNWGIWEPWRWAPRFSHAWRTTMDIFPAFWRVLEIVDYSEPLADYVKPGAFNDMDMLECGVSGRLFNWPSMPEIVPLDVNECRSHFTLWVLLRSPLVLGMDMTKIQDEDMSVVTNEEVLSIVRQGGETQGRRLSREISGALFAPPTLFNGILGLVPSFCVFGPCVFSETYARVSDDGKSVAVGFLNRGGFFDFGFDSSVNISVHLDEDLGLRGEKCTIRVRDLWNRKDVERSSTDARVITAHNVRLRDMALYRVESENCKFDQIRIDDHHASRMSLFEVMIVTILGVVASRIVFRRSSR